MKTPKPSSNPGGLDAMTGHYIILSHGHHEIHEGCSYTAHARATALGSSAALALAFKTPPATSGLAHLLVSWVSEGKAKVEILETAGWTTNTGTLVPIYSRNRESPGSSALQEDKTSTPTFTATQQVLQDPTALTGTVIHTQTSYAGNFATGGARGLQEFVLKAGTQYAVRITNEDGSAKGIEIEIDWYEEDK